MAQYRRVSDTIFDILDSNTGEYFSYSKVTEYADKSPMTDAKVDNIIYVKLGSEYFKRNYTGPISVKWFGAKGNGTTDDRAAIQKAINLAVVINNDVFFPAGTYNLTTFNPDNYGTIIRFPDISDPTLVYSIKLYGENKTKLTTTLLPDGSVSRSILFYLNRTSLHLTIQNIFFESLHAVTTYSTTAIFTSGASANRITNLQIVDCTFQGFSQDILLQGVTNPIIDGCFFSSPKGRDNATSNTAPAVYVNMLSTTNGQVINPVIRNCQVNGYSGTDITTTSSKAPKDGFIVGSCVGGQFYNNYCQNLGVESICANSYNAGGIKMVRIYDNTIDCTPPTGAQRYNGDAQLVTYGIRSECNFSVIENNTILNASYGIIQDAQSAALDYSFNKWIIKNNTFSFSTGTNFRTMFGVNLRGFSDTNRAANGEISGNTFILDSVSLTENFSLFALTSTNNFKIEGNSVLINTFAANSFTCNYLYLLRSNNVRLGDDYLDPIFSPFQLVSTSPASTYSFYNSPVITVNTYANMLTTATGPQYKKILVKNDENKTLTNTLYEYFPATAILYLSTTIEVTL